MRHDERIDSCGNIIQHNASAAMQAFELPCRRRLHDIK
jgi:hypothetical protein